MKIYAAAFNRVMLTCRACGTRFFVKSPQTAAEELEPAAEAEAPETEGPSSEEAVAVSESAETPVRRGLRVRLKIRTRRRSEFRAVS